MVNFHKRLVWWFKLRVFIFRIGIKKCEKKGLGEWLANGSTDPLPCTSVGKNGTMDLQIRSILATKKFKNKFLEGRELHPMAMGFRCYMPRLCEIGPEQSSSCPVA
jgi:hypothetical protein